jgi:transposase
MRFQQRGEFLRKILDQVRSNNYPYLERDKAEMDWSNYDAAQCREIVDVINIIREVVNEAAARIALRKARAFPGPGRPATEPADIVKVMMLQSYFGVPNRPAEGLRILFSDRLGIRSDFSYKTIERGYDREGVKELLDEVFKLTNEQIQGSETVYSVDGSGSSTSNKQNYCQSRQNQRNRTSSKSDQGEWPKENRAGTKDYQYHLSVIGVYSKMFAAWVTNSDHRKGEQNLFPMAMKMAINNQPSMEAILGDGAFAGRPQCNIVDEYGVEPMFLPKRNVKFQSRGSKSWAKMLGKILKNPQQFLSDYHMRSISETGFSMIGSENPQPLRKRLEQRKGTEDYLRGICHNVKRLCYLSYLWELDIDFRRTRPAG